MRTERLEIRLPREADRARFVELFCDEAFMVFSAGVLTPGAANERFDGMLRRAEELPFAKQPLVERSSGAIVGYAGVDWFTHDGRRWFEFGWRLVPEARGRGYATEAARAVLGVASACYEGEILAIIDPANTASGNVARKVGFTLWRQATVDGYLVDLHRITVPHGTGEAKVC